MCRAMITRWEGPMVSRLKLCSCYYISCNKGTNFDLGDLNYSSITAVILCICTFTVDSMTI